MKHSYTGNKPLVNPCLYTSSLYQCTNPDHSGSVLCLAIIMHMLKAKGLFLGAISSALYDIVEEFSIIINP